MARVLEPWTVLDAGQRLKAISQEVAVAAGYLDNTAATAEPQRGSGAVEFWLEDVWVGYIWPMKSRNGWWYAIRNRIT